MKKFIKFLLPSFFLFFAHYSHSAVWGLKELAPKSEVKKILMDRYGYDNFSDEGDKIVVYNPIVGGEEFNLCELYFVVIDGVPKLNEIIFQAWFTNTTLVKNKRDRISNNLKEKYGDNMWEYLTPQQFKGYEFGLNDEGNIGHIEIQRTKGKDGKERLYLFLVYHPFSKTAIINDL